MIARDLVPNRKYHLDLLRGVAAQLVVIGHAYSLFVLNQHQAFGSRHPDNTTVSWLGWQVAELFVARGAYAVFWFFVLSGLLVGGPMRGRFREGTFRFGDYLLKRLVRMYSVLLPTLLLSAIAIYLSFRLGAGQDVLAFNTPWYPADWPVAESMSGAALACNALFLQTIACVQFAHNSSIWSLANEFHYYLLFPALLAVVAAMRRGSGRTALWLAVCVGIVALWTVPAFRGRPSRTGVFLYGFAIWVLGAFSPELLRQLREIGQRLTAGRLWLGAFGCIIAMGGAYAIGTETLRVSASIGLALVVMVMGPELDALIGQVPMVRRGIVLLSDYSYSIYSVHVPLFFVLLSFSPFLLAKSLVGLPGLAGFALLVFAANIVAWIFYHLFEKHHVTVLRMLKQRLRQHTSLKPST